MGLARYLGLYTLLCSTALAAPAPAQIQVVNNLVIPGRVADLMSDAMLLKAPSGEAFVLPRHLAVRLEDTRVHSQLEVGSQVSVMVPLDSSEVVAANSRMVTLKTGTGLIQLPVSLMPKEMMAGTLIGSRDKKGRSQDWTLTQAISAGGMISPESFAYWNQPRSASGVVVAKKTDGDLLLATMIDGLPALRQLKTGGMSTDWVTVGSPVTVARQPQLDFYQVQPWKDAAYWQASQTPPAETAQPAERKIHRGIVPRKVQVSARIVAVRPKPVRARIPSPKYPLAVRHKRTAVASLPTPVETQASLLLPIYNVVSAPLKAVTVAPVALQQSLPTYADISQGVIPGYNSKSRIKDGLPGY